MAQSTASAELVYFTERGSGPPLLTLARRFPNPLLKVLIPSGERVKAAGRAR
jgi:hypothetical protein